MKITDLPFNKLIGLSESEDPQFIYSLKDHIQYSNHIGTVHASALFSLAEASAAQFLLQNFPEYENNMIPIVRKVELKYKKPAMGQINSTAKFSNNTETEIRSELQSRSRALIVLIVELWDKNSANVMSATFEWFISTKTVNI